MDNGYNKRVSSFNYEEGIRAEGAYYGSEVRPVQIDLGTVRPTVSLEDLVYSGVLGSPVEVDGRIYFMDDVEK